MLAVVMRLILISATAMTLSLLGLGLWLFAGAPSDAESAKIAAVLASTGAPDAPPAYAHCASCHLHDGSGRPDGSIPRLNGQRRAVLESKLHRMRAGLTRLPVMDPFARTLTAKEVAEVAGYLSELPDTAIQTAREAGESGAEGAALFAEHCASCHGARGEGHDGLFASRLCGQYEGYMARRLEEVRGRARGDSDAVMQGVLEGLGDRDLAPVLRWLASGEGCLAQ
jgi:cytochrome c553